LLKYNPYTLTANDLACICKLELGAKLVSNPIEVHKRTKRMECELGIEIRHDIISQINDELF
jgi:hypothetical protein